jgi:hypothetical protein
MIAKSDKVVKGFFKKREESLLQKLRGSAGGAPSPERSRLPEPCGGQVGASADSTARLDWSPVLQDAAKLAALLSEFCKRLSSKVVDEVDALVHMVERGGAGWELISAREMNSCGDCGV